MNSIILWAGMWPDWYTRAIGCYQLAYWLRKNKVESQVIDFCQWYKAEELVELTIPFISSATKYIGISSSFWPDSSKMPLNISLAIQLLKQEYPQMKFILGGPRAAGYENQEQLIDIILTGEAEDSLLTLIKGHNLSPMFDITKLEHRFSDQDCIVEGEVLPIELGRGCIFKCKFCGHHNLGKPKHTYQRPIHLIEQEIAYNYEKWNTTYYHYLDDTVNEDIEKIKNLAKIPTHTGVPIKWNGYLRVDLIWSHPHTAELLKESGLKSCFLGIESFHPKASSIIGKGWSGKHGKSFLPHLHRNLWNNEISMWCNFIVGLPEEDLTSLEDTLAWCKENRLGSHRFAPLTLYHTTSGVKSYFTENYEKYGYSVDSIFWSNSIMNSNIAEDISNRFNSELQTVTYPTSWIAFDLINCGIDLEKSKNQMLFTRYKYNVLFRNKFLSKYIAQLKKL